MIEYVTIDQAAELDAFVLRQPNCHFMQTSAWGRVKEGWGWTGILCRDEKGEIIGSMAILEHRIRHMHTGFLYARAADLPGRRLCYARGACGRHARAGREARRTI